MKIMIVIVICFLFFLIIMEWIKQHKRKICSHGMSNEKQQNKNMNVFKKFQARFVHLIEHCTFSTSAIRKKEEEEEKRKRLKSHVQWITCTNNTMNCSYLINCSIRCRGNSWLFIFSFKSDPQHFSSGAFWFNKKLTAKISQSPLILE